MSRSAKERHERSFVDELLASAKAGVRRDDGSVSRSTHRANRDDDERGLLAFTQLAHWNWNQLKARHSIRQVASAIRIRGRLNLDALQSSGNEIFQRHDALRTRIRVLDEIPLQEVALDETCQLTITDLAHVSSASREVEVRRILDETILDPVDVAVGPLCVLKVLRLREDEHVLIVAMEHMISDEVSMGVLVRELLTGYSQVLNHRAVCLTEVQVQFPRYAAWQRKTHEGWLQTHGQYWQKQLPSCRRLRFPEDGEKLDAPRIGWATVPFNIRPALKRGLRDWSRQRRTTLVMSVLAAYIGAVLRWCDATDVTVQCVTDGRVGSKIAHTIGFFAAPLYLNINLAADDTFLDLLAHITERYCLAYEHADFSYFASQQPRPEFTRSTVFNWVPRGAGFELPELRGSSSEFDCSPVHFQHPMLKKLEADYEPRVLLFDADEEVVGGIHFPVNRFSNAAMTRFAKSFLVTIEAMLSRPDRRVREVCRAE